MALQIFPKASGGGVERLQLIGDPARLPGVGTTRRTSGPGWRSRGRLPSGLAPWGRTSRPAGDDLASSWRSRASRPTGPARDRGGPTLNKRSARSSPRCASSTGWRSPGNGRPGPLRGEGGTRRLRPSEPDRRGLSGPGRRRRVVGVVLAGESDGLVGAVLRRSPGRSPRRARPVRPPARCATGSRSRRSPSTAGARPWSSGWRPARRLPVRRHSSGHSRGRRRRRLQGHFHAAVVPYRPLPGGAFELAATVHTCSSPAGSRRSSTCSATRGRSSGPARARSPGGSSGTSLRQESLGKEEETRTRKPFVGTLRVSNPAWQSRASSQKRVLRGVGRPTLRSVDSQVKGRVIEPRKLKTRGAFVVDIRGGRVRRVAPGPTERCLVPPGSKSTDNDHQGSPGTWETPTSPSSIPDRETGTTNSRAPGGDAHDRGERNTGDTSGIAKRRQRSAARRAAGSRSVP